MTSTLREPRIPLAQDRRYQPELGEALGAYQAAVVRLSSLDPVTTELVRLRCARQHDCGT